MLNLLWLLLPVAAAGGWFAARRAGARRSAAFWNYSSDFHAGLGALLDERRERPVELFTTLSDTDRDTAETHLALGRLFRRRGEMDRAILLHESLLERDELGAAVHADARYELARDYGSAGLLDRAEAVLRELVDSGHRVDDAYESLLELHERERDWRRAIEVALEASAAGAKGGGAGRRDKLIAHYRCELAAEARDAGYAGEARTLLEDALGSFAECARANMMLADMALADGDHATAIERYARVEAQRPELAPEIVERRVRALAAHDDPAPLREWIERVRGQRNAYSVVRAARALIERLDGAPAAERFFHRQILARPSLRGLRDWAQDQLPRSRPGEREKVQIICELLDGVVEERPNYLCASCGFGGNVLHWRCPSCGTWDSVGLVIGAEGE